MANPKQFPIKTATTQRLTISRRQAGMASTTTGRTQVITGGVDWMLTWTWPRMTYLKATEINAWIASLNGMEETFIYRPNQPRDASPLTLRYTTSIGYQYNNSVVIGGWAPNVASDLYLGMYLQIGEQLLIVTEASAFADASGRVTIKVAPWFRLTYPAGAAVNFVNPAGVFRLTESSGVGFTLDPDRAPEFGTLTAVEAV